MTTPDKVTITRFAEMSGYTTGAVHKKIERGVWLEGVQWFRAPDGRILISIEGYDSWVGGQGFSQLIRIQSRSTSSTTASDVESASASRIPRQISPTAEGGSDE